MIRYLTDALFALTLIAGIAWYWNRETAPQVQPLPPVQPGPAPILPKPILPRPIPPAPPCPPLGPWPSGSAPVGADPGSIGPVAPDGTEPQVDYPEWEWMRNIGSRRDGAGMCVFTSWEMSCRNAGLEAFRGFRNWCAERYPGGGYPSKLAKLVKAYCQAKDIPTSVFDPDKDIIQYEGGSLALAEASLKNGGLPSVTLYHSPRYGRGTIYHMVNLAHLDAKIGAILDNNFKPLEWASRDQTIGKMKMRGTIWIAVLAKPGPPPLPKN